MPPCTLSCSVTSKSPRGLWHADIHSYDCSSYCDKHFSCLFHSVRGTGSVLHAFNNNPNASLVLAAGGVTRASCFALVALWHRILPLPGSSILFWLPHGCFKTTMRIWATTSSFMYWCLTLQPFSPCHNFMPRCFRQKKLLTQAQFKEC